MKFDLQYFAATDLINVLNSGTAGSYAVNGETGAARTPNADNNLSPEIKDFYDTDLLKNYRTKMVYGQFAKNVAMPYHRGGVVEFRKFNRFKKADKLQEGVIPEGQPLGVTKITGAIGQYGTYTAVSDILEMRGYDPVISACIDEMAESAAYTHEMLIRDALAAGTNVMSAEGVAADGTIQTAESRDELGADSDTYNYLLTPKMVNRIYTHMRKNKVPYLPGNTYAMVCHPSVIYDLRESNEWLGLMKYTNAGVERIFNGEAGMIHNVRIIINPDAPVLGEKLTDGDTPCEVKLEVLATAGLTFTLSGTTLPEADCLKGIKVRFTDEDGERTITGNTTTTVTVDGEARTVAADQILRAAGAAGNGQHVYLSYAFGLDAFATVDPAGGWLEVIVKGKEYGGPLNQFSTIGYKFETNGATILYPERMVRLESLSSYGATDDAN